MQEGKEKAWLGVRRSAESSPTICSSNLRPTLWELCCVTVNNKVSLESPFIANSNYSDCNAKFDTKKVFNHK